MADLLSDETGQDSVLDVPMQSPGVPRRASDCGRRPTPGHRNGITTPAAWGPRHSAPGRDQEDRLTATSAPGFGERRDEIGRGSDGVRMFVSDTLIRVGHDATVRELARRMAAEGVGALVVTEGDQVQGIVSERDVVVAMAAGKDLDSTTAADIDSRRLVTCTPDTSVREAAVLDMMEHYVRQFCSSTTTPGRSEFGPRPPWCRSGAIPPLLVEMAGRCPASSGSPAPAMTVACREVRRPRGHSGRR